MHVAPESFRFIDNTLVYILIIPTFFIYIGAIVLLTEFTELKEPSEMDKKEFMEYREASYQTQVSGILLYKSLSLRSGLVRPSSYMYIKINSKFYMYVDLKQFKT